jgi:anti-sigma factor RsiW
MNEAEYQELLEASWRRDLTPAERARLHAALAEQPELRAGWEDESGLNYLLDRLPDTPLASNFTARVLQEAQRQAARPSHRPFLDGLWRRLFPRPAAGVAWVAVMLCLGWLAVELAQTTSQRRRNSELADFFKAAAPPDPSVLQDFEAIRRLPQAEDEELLAVLSK